MAGTWYNVAYDPNPWSGGPILLEVGGHYMLRLIDVGGYPPFPQITVPINIGITDGTVSVLGTRADGNVKMEIEFIKNREPEKDFRPTLRMLAETNGNSATTFLLFAWQPGEGAPPSQPPGGGSGPQLPGINVDIDTEGLAKALTMIGAGIVVVLLLSD